MGYDRRILHSVGASRGAQWEPHTVLYVEDNAVNLRLVQRIFERRPDIRLVSAQTGLDGVGAARQHLPAVVLLDLHLPDIDGDEVLRRLRADPSTASIPVVIVSADAHEQQINRLLNSGASTYITKPIDIHELTRTVDAMIERHASQR